MVAKGGEKKETEETRKEEASQSELVQLSGLWLNKSKDGKTSYFAGYLGSAKILIFKNKFKKEDKHPDYVLYVAPNIPKSDEADDEDIPF